MYLNGNPLKRPPLEIATDTSNIDKIRNYFEELENQGEDYIYEAKLLFVGEPGAGKTSLAEKLLDPDYALRPDEPMTEGIDVKKWRFPTRIRSLSVAISGTLGQEADREKLHIEIKPMIEVNTKIKVEGSKTVVNTHAAARTVVDVTVSVDLKVEPPAPRSGENQSGSSPCIALIDKHIA